MITFFTHPLTHHQQNENETDIMQHCNILIINNEVSDISSMNEPNVIFDLFLRKPAMNEQGILIDKDKREIVLVCMTHGARATRDWEKRTKEDHDGGDSPDDYR
jgi:hypothetical protein